MKPVNEKDDVSSMLWPVRNLTGCLKTIGYSASGRVYDAMTSRLTGNLTSRLSGQMTSSFTWSRLWERYTHQGFKEDDKEVEEVVKEEVKCLERNQERRSNRKDLDVYEGRDNNSTSKQSEGTVELKGIWSVMSRTRIATMRRRMVDVSQSAGVLVAMATMVSAAMVALAIFGALVTVVEVAMVTLAFVGVLVVIGSVILLGIFCVLFILYKTVPHDHKHSL